MTDKLTFDERINKEYGCWQEFVQYPLDVVKGKIVSGIHVKRQCQKYLDWMKDPDKKGYEFRPDKALKPVKFAALLKHTKGKMSGCPFILLPFQRFLCYAVYGWYIKGTEQRVIHNVYLECCRKVGKSAICSFLGLYMLVADGEASPEVLTVSPSRQQK